MTDTTFNSSFPRKNVTPYHDTGRESIFGHCRQPSDLGGTNTHFHPSVCRRQGCMDDSSENSLCSTNIRHSGGEPAPYPDTGQESSLPSLPTLDYRRKDCRHFHLPWCRWQPAWLIAMKIGHVKPVVGATLVVARSRRQPVFIPLCGLRNAMVIPRSAATKNLQSLPRRADRGRQNEIATMIQPLPSCHWYENDRHNLQIVIPAKERHPVPRYGAGIHLRPLPAAE